MPIITITVVSAMSSATRPGHAFISFNSEVSGPLALGFYPRQERELTPELFKMGVRTPGEVKPEIFANYLEAEDQAYVNQLHVEVSQAEYDAMRDFAVQEADGNPPGGASNSRQYDFFGRDAVDTGARNCVTWVNEVLNQGGLGVDPGLLYALAPSSGVIRTIENLSNIQHMPHDVDFFYPAGTQPHLPQQAIDFHTGNSNLADAAASGLSSALNAWNAEVARVRSSEMFTNWVFDTYDSTVSNAAEVMTIVTLAHQQSVIAASDGMSLIAGQFRTSQEWLTEPIESASSNLSEVTSAARDVTNRVEELVSSASASLEQAMQDLLTAGARAVGDLLDIYQQAQDFAQRPAQDVKQFYDDVLAWTADRSADLAKLYGMPEAAAVYVSDRLRAAGEDASETGLSEFGGFLDGTLGRLEKAYDGDAGAIALPKVGGDVTDFIGWIASRFFILPNGSGADPDGDGILDAPTFRAAFDVLGEFQRAAASWRIYRADPLVLDLNGNGIELVQAADSQANFDLNADGVRERVGWIGATDGFLVLDENGDGEVPNIGDLFGSETQIGFAELAAHDLLENGGNEDGTIDAADAVFVDLQIWRDLNGDGDVDTGELGSVADYSIKSISLSFSPFAESNSNPGTILTEIGSYELDNGAIRITGDALLERQTLVGNVYTPIDESPTTLGLPNFRGYGGMRNLREAMSKDSGLESDVRGLLSGLPQQIFDGVDSILYRWAGAQNVDAQSRGSFIDARRLAALEVFTGTPFRNIQTGPIPDFNAAGILNNAWAMVREHYAARFLVFSSLFEQILPNAAYSPSTDFLVLNEDVRNVGIRLRNMRATGDPGVETAISLLPLVFRNSENSRDDLLLFDNAGNRGLNSTVTGIAFTDTGDGNDIVTTGTLEGLHYTGFGNDSFTFSNGGDHTLVNEGGDDFVQSLDVGDFVFYALGGNNRVVVRNGQHVISTGGGYDQIDVGSGDSFIDVGGGNNTVNASTGGSQVGDFVIHSGDGIDLIGWSGAASGRMRGNMTIRSGDGHKKIYAADGNYDIELGANTITRYGATAIDLGAGDSSIATGDGDHRISLGAGTHAIVTGGGNDQVDVGSGDSFIDVGDGNNTVNATTGGGQVGDFVIHTGDGIDLIGWSGAGPGRMRGNMTIRAGDGHKKLYAADGNYDIELGANTITRYGATVIDLGVGDSTITTGNGDHRIWLGAGTHAVVTGGGNDQVDVGSGDSYIDAGDGTNVINASSVAPNGNFSIVTGAGNDRIGNQYFSYRMTGDVTVEAGDGNNSIFLGNGNNAVTTGSGADTIDIGSGDDVVKAGAGNDTIRAGTGDDVLDGGAGNDTYYGVGTGSDTIRDIAGTDVVVLGGQIDFSQISLGVDQQSLSIDSAAGQLRIEGFDSQYAETSLQIETFVFWSGAVSKAQLLAAGFDWAGIEGDDVFLGTSVTDRIDARSGSDVVFAGAGADDIDATGGGNDFVDAGPGNDRIEIDGGALAIGAAGDDAIGVHGVGAVVLFNPGDGDDTVYVASDAFTLSIGGGIGAADLSLSGDGAALTLTVGHGDSITLVSDDYDSAQGYAGISLQLFGSVHRYDFKAVIDGFLASGADVQNLGDVLGAYETSFSNRRAIGGAIAWQYATAGNVLTLTAEALHDVVIADEFGVGAQYIDPSKVNVPPAVALPIADQSTPEDAAFELSVADAFFDLDAHDILGFEGALADGALLPTWLAFDALSATFSGTPGNDDVGTLEITVTATDPDSEKVSDTFLLQVENVNDPPLAVDDAGAAQEDGGPVALSVTSLLVNDSDIDADDSLAIVGVTNSAAGAVVSLVDGNVVYDPGALFQSFAVGATVLDSFSYTIADEAGETSTTSVAMTITGANDAPMLVDSIAAQAGRVGEALAFSVDGAFADVDAGDHLAYDATLADASVLPAWLVFDPTNVSFSGTPGAGDGGAYVVRVTATDAAGDHTAADIALNVEGLPPEDPGGHGKGKAWHHGHDHGGDHPGGGTGHDKHWKRGLDDHGKYDHPRHRNPERNHDGIRERIGKSPMFDFDALLAEFERGERHEKISLAEIRRGWHKVADFAARLGAGEDDAAHGMLWRGASDFSRIATSGGHGFGFDGSIGATRGAEEFKSFEGLREGFRRL